MRTRPLEGKTAVITGASKGNGKAIAELFAEEGANVVLTARGRRNSRQSVKLSRQGTASALLVLGALALAPACAHRASAIPPPGGGGQSMSITAARERGSVPGGNENFTGEATISMLFSPNGPRDFSAAYVSFQPSARTAWHSHPAGQTLVVTEGSGWVQIEGEARRDMSPGDVVWTPPNARHWHGATSSSAVTHMALQGEVDGSVVTWFDHVSDAQYLGTDAG